MRDRSSDREFYRFEYYYEYQEGYAAGQSRYDKPIPYCGGTPHYRAWMIGFEDGQADAADKYNSEKYGF